MTRLRRAVFGVGAFAAVAAGAGWFLSSAPERSGFEDHVERASPGAPGSPELVGMAGAEAKRRAAASELARGAERPRALAGRVTLSDGSPVAAAEVVASLYVEWRPSRAFGTAVTSATGEYRVALPPGLALPTSRSDLATIYVLAWRSGRGLGEAFLIDIDPMAQRMPQGGELEADVVLGDIPPLWGRVVDADGRPVADARVFPCAPTAGLVDLDQQMVFSGADGRFVVAVAADFAGELLAAHPAHGWARLPSAAFVHDQALPDLVLACPFTVAGSVVYADGAPAGGVPVRVSPPSGSEGVNSHTCWAVAGGGNVTSGNDGRFHCCVLDQGAHYVSTLDAVDPIEVLPGESNVRLVLKSHRVRVRVEDEAGNLVPGVSFTAMGWSAANADKLDDLEAGRIAFEAAGAHTEWRQQHSGQGEDGEHDLFVAHGSAWTVSAGSPATGTAEAALRVPETGNESQLRLVLRPPSAGGALRIRWLDADGHLVPFVLTEVHSRFGAQHFRGVVEGDSVIENLPPGPLSVKMQERKDPADSGSIDPSAVWSCTATFPATVRAGQTTVVEGRAVAGGRLRVRLVAPWNSTEVPQGGVGSVPYHCYGIVYLVNDEPGQDDRLLEFEERRADGSTAVGAHIGMNHPCLGLDLLPPGEHHIRAGVAGQGASVVSTFVRVVPGQIVDVDLLLPVPR